VPTLRVLTLNVELERKITKNQLSTVKGLQWITEVLSHAGSFASQ